MKGSAYKERGIALVIVIFALVLVGLLGATILLSSLSNQVESADLEAERAAYAQAELGAQAAINILRGHGGPNAIESRINLYISVNDKTKINAANTAEVPLARLGRWLPYQTAKRLTRVNAGVAQAIEDTYMVVTDSSRGLEPLGYSLLLKSEVPDVPVANPFPSGTTPGQIRRIRVTSTGYGPRGAVKVIRVQISSPGGINLPAPFIFNAVPGSFTGKVTGSCKQYWDGRDYAFSPPASGFPMVAYTDTSQKTNFTEYFDGISKPDDCSIPGAGQPDTVVATTLPNWSENPFNNPTSTQAFVDGLRPYVSYRGPLPTPVSSSINFGSAANPQVVIIEGDADFATFKGPTILTGGGIIVFTGNLILRTAGDTLSWKGLVLVQGTLLSDTGSGNINIEGGLAYVPKSGSGTVSLTSDFQLRYNSSLINGALSKLPVGVISEY
jgi:hypothetical protein